MPVKNPLSRPVVVPVGSDPVDAALRFAAAEAARAGCGVHLLHAAQPTPRGPEAPVPDGGAEALDAALDRAREILPEGTPVTGAVVTGAVVPALVHATEAGARMVVLEHRDLSWLQRLVHRSVTGGVGAHSRAPVVSVPTGWREDPSQGRVVTVGVDRPDHSEQVLRAGFEAARSRGATVRLVHAWGHAASYDELALAGVEPDRWNARARAEIQAAVDRLPHDLTDTVTYEIEVRHSDAASLLVEMGASCDLVVIGRHDPVVPVGSHLGPVARTVLHVSRTPVLLADPRPAHRWRRAG